MNRRAAATQVIPAHAPPAARPRGREAVSAVRGRRGDSTSNDAFAAGWADGADDKRLTPAEVDWLVALHTRYLLPSTA